MPAKYLCNLSTLPIIMVASVLYFGFQHPIGELAIISAFAYSATILYNNSQLVYESWQDTMKILKKL